MKMRAPPIPSKPAIKPEAATTLQETHKQKCIRGLRNDERVADSEQAGDKAGRRDDAAASTKAHLL